MQLAKFRLSLLGRFELTGRDGLIDLPNKKLAGLLTYLACTAPVPQPRERLTDLLWGSHFETQAQQNLRQALFRLRRTLGQDVLVSDGNEISLAPGAIECDAIRLQDLIREGSRDSLAEAVGLYKAPLADLSITEEAWTDWVTAARQRIEGAVLDAMVRFGEIELAASHGDKALETAHRAIAINNLREDAHRLVMRALAGAGRKAEAFKHYQGLVAQLKHELNTEPDAATKALVAGLGGSPAPGQPVSPGADQPVAAQRPADTDGALAPLGSEESAIAGPAQPERRQLTIMACNLVGSSQLSARLDPEDMRDLIATFHERIAAVAAGFGGFVAQYQSDGALLYFGYPEAHEHDAERAVRSSLAVLDAVGRLKAPTGACLQARAGIATGLVVVGEQGTHASRQRVAIGETPILAAQLQAAAPPGAIVVAASTRRLVGRLFDYTPFPAIETNGQPQPVEAWLVQGEKADVTRFEALRAGALPPLVGRHEEVELLVRRWNQAKLGEGRVVLLTGEPGIGKSRIAESLLAGLKGEPHARLRYSCSPHHAHSPLFPFIAQIERVAGFEPGNSAAEKLDKLETLLGPATADSRRRVGLIAELLSIPAGERCPPLALSPQQKREMTFLALLEQLDRMAANTPVVIVFEDVHWIDPTSLDLLDRTVARVADLPVLLIVLFRPEFQPTWIEQPHVTMVSLNRHDRRESAAILEGVTKGKALADPVVDRILAHADGVPLFIEELTSTLLESELVRETTDRFVLEGPLPSIAIPTTLQASLVARLDRLGPVKEVAQIGSAIGREFSHALIGAVSTLAAADLNTALERLAASGLMSRRGTPPDATYLFKHALVQDAAYATLLKSRRRELHSSIATAMVERFPALAESRPEVIAHHFTEAGISSEAISHWRKAGQLASARSANREAVASFERALQLLKAQPETREGMELAIDVLFDLRTALFQLGEFEQVLGHLREAEGLARRLGDQWRLGRLSVYLCHNRVMAGRPIEAIGFGQNAQAIADTLGDVQLQVTANLDLGSAYVFAGNYPSAEDLMRKVLSRLEGERQLERYGQTIFPAVAALGYLAWIFADQGRFKEGIARGREALQLAETLNQPYSLAYALWALARPHIVQGDFDGAIGLLERGVALSRERSLTFLSVLTTGGLGYAYAHSGRMVEGIPLLRQALGGNEAAREEAMLPLSLMYLGEAYILAGRFQDALTYVKRALTLGRDHGQRGYEAPSLWLLGEISARDGAAEHADGHYRQAFALAETIGFRPLAAHCRISLARLCRRTGKGPEAQQHLAAAAAMYREMDMPYWLEQAEAATRQR